MIKAKLKQFLKTNSLIFNLLVGVLFLYLKFAYATSRWKFTWEGQQQGQKDDEYIEKNRPNLFALWHCQLAYSIKIFGKYKEVKALISPHSDGRIIGGIVQKFGYEVIEGSSYKNSNGALKEILSNLKAGVNVVITPDGPRGPAKEVNSVITKIASKYGYNLIAASCKPSRYFTLNSWDKMMFPKPFATIEVHFSKVIELTCDEERDKKLLKLKLEEYL